MGIRVLIAEDHTIVRQGLRVLLEATGRFAIVGEAGDGQEAVALAAQALPDLVVMDLHMPRLNGVEATRQILLRRPAVKVVALSMIMEDRLILEIFRAGARGYVLKKGALHDLVIAAETVLSGRIYLSQELRGGALEEQVKEVASGRGRPAAGPLTSRQRQVLQLLAEGRTAKEVAAALAVTLKTVETHRYHIMQKLGLHSVAELTRYAIREGLTSLDA